MKTAEDFKRQAQAKDIEFWLVHECSMCGYPCGYVISGDSVGYDTGCDCTYGRGGVQPRSWENLAESYNMNTPERNPGISPEYTKKVNEFWGF